MLSQSHGERADGPEGVPVSVLIVAPGWTSAREYYNRITSIGAKYRDDDRVGGGRVEDRRGGEKVPEKV